MSIAVLFSNQGSQVLGMSKEEILRPLTKEIQMGCVKTHNRLKETYGFDINTVLFEQSDYIQVSHKGEVSTINVPGGALDKLIRFTQPSLLLSQWVLYKTLTHKYPSLVNRPKLFAGYSLGEFTALACIEVLPIDIASELVYSRGLYMEQSLGMHTPFYALHDECRAFVVHPKLAKLSGEDLFIYIEMVSKLLLPRCSVLEVASVHIDSEEYTVSGTLDALAVLGKILDPLFRANVNSGKPNSVQWYMDVVQAAIERVLEDISDGITTNPDKPLPRDSIRSFPLYRRFESPGMPVPISLDDYTLPLERLEHLSYVGIGRSGLKQRSWYTPLANSTVPCHTSTLRRTMDQLYDTVLNALPSSDLILSKLDPNSSNNRWFTNLTGTEFKPNCPVFRAGVSSAIQSLNVGEQQHSGRYVPECEEKLMFNSVKGSPRELLAAMLSAQASHTVQWHKLLKDIVKVGIKAGIEISPRPTLGRIWSLHPSVRASDAPMVYNIPKEWDYFDFKKLMKNL